MVRSIGSIGILDVIDRIDRIIRSIDVPIVRIIRSIDVPIDRIIRSIHAPTDRIIRSIDVPIDRIIRSTHVPIDHIIRSIHVPIDRIIPSIGVPTDAIIPSIHAPMDQSFIGTDQRDAHSRHRTHRPIDRSTAPSTDPVGDDSIPEFRNECDHHDYDDPHTPTRLDARAHVPGRPNRSNAFSHALSARPCSPPRFRSRRSSPRSYRSRFLGIVADCDAFVRNTPTSPR